jgi:hypothetical protein
MAQITVLVYTKKEDEFNLMALYQMVLQLQKQLKELAINQLKVFTDVRSSDVGQNITTLPCKSSIQVK